MITMANVKMLGGYPQAQWLEQHFIDSVREQRLPLPAKDLAGLSAADVLDLFDSQLASRQIDGVARYLRQEGIGYYTIASSGHEANAVFGLVFPYTDIALLHYRSGAFFIQRAKQINGFNAIEAIILSLCAARTDPIAGGRHKVFGSKALNIPPQTSTIASHLPKAVGVALSITRAKALAIAHPLMDDSVVLCSFGDASVNHASAQVAFHTAQWLCHEHYPLPLIFICEDNGLGISTPTPKDWVKTAMQTRSGLHYIGADGLSLPALFTACQEADYYARVKKQAVFLHMRCVRLLAHAGSDIESEYLSAEQIQHQVDNDPLLHTASLLIDQNILRADDIIERYQAMGRRVTQAKNDLQQAPLLQSAEQVAKALLPRSITLSLPALPSDAKRRRCFGQRYASLSWQRSLAQQINLGLTDLMCQYPNIVLFGEDVGAKGGVYHVTAGLQQCFGKGRVFDTLLDETTILGTAIGMAHNGFLPIAEIQYLAYLHNAEDQLRSEAAMLSFLSDGQYCNPLIIRIASFSYQEGIGGPFHNENAISMLRDIPGLIVACPSQGSDAVKMLRECVRLAYQEGRVVVFLEPIALYGKKDLSTFGDKQWLSYYPALDQIIGLSDITVVGEGDIVIVSYGNGVYLSRQAQVILSEHYAIQVRVIDLHWLSPLPVSALVKALKTAKAVLIVDETRRSASPSEALITLCVEELSPMPVVKRLTADDCFVPQGRSAATLMPSAEGIVSEVIALKS